MSLPLHFTVCFSSAGLCNKRILRCCFHDFGNVNCVSPSAFSLDGDLAFPPPLVEVAVAHLDPLACPGIPSTVSSRCRSHIRAPNSKVELGKFGLPWFAGMNMQWPSSAASWDFAELGLCPSSSCHALSSCLEGKWPAVLLGWAFLVETWGCLSLPSSLTGRWDLLLSYLSEDLPQPDSHTLSGSWQDPCRLWWSFISFIRLSLQNNQNHANKSSHYCCINLAS